MDISFASLGWISFAREQSFTLIPWCVQGSVFSKRKALYPFNLSDEGVERQRDIWEEDIHFLETEEARKRLDGASRQGRKNSGSTKNRGNGANDYDDDFIYDHHYYNDDDEWYS